MKVIKKDKYEISDRVKIVDKWNDKTNEETLYGSMDKWLEQIMTIKKVESMNGYYRMKEDKTWMWNKYCIKGQVIFEVGDIVLIDENSTTMYAGQVGEVVNVSKHSVNVDFPFGHKNFPIKDTDILKVSPIHKGDILITAIGKYKVKDIIKPTNSSLFVYYTHKELFFKENTEILLGYKKVIKNGRLTTYKTIYF